MAGFLNPAQLLALERNSRWNGGWRRQTRGFAWRGVGEHARELPWEGGKGNMLGGAPGGGGGSPPGRGAGGVGGRDGVVQRRAGPPPLIFNGKTRLN